MIPCHRTYRNKYLALGIIFLPHAMATPINDREERIPLNTAPLEERILAVVRRSRRDDEGVGGGGGRRTIRPAILASELGLSIEEATRELCGLLSAVGGGEDGASFAFERVGMPAAAAAAGGEGGGHDDRGASSSSAAAAAAAAIGASTTTTMAFTFPADFEERALRHRRRSDLGRRLRVLMTVLVRAIKVFTAFGLVVSLAVLIIAGMCLLVAAVVAMARGGGGGEGGGRGNHHLMRKLRYLFFQLRQILWLYAICGSVADDGSGRQDPFLREVAGDLAMMMSVCTNPYHPFFWMRLGGMRRRWERTRRSSRGWGGGGGDVDVVANARMDGIAMMRRGTWGGGNDDDDDDDNDDDGHRREDRHSGSWSSLDRIGDQQQQQQRGLLSIAVEFLFGPGETTTSIAGGDPLSPTELDKWKFRAAVIISLSSKSPGSGVSLRDLLPYVDDPPSHAADPSAIRETLRMVAYFNGRPSPHRTGAGGDGGVDEADRRSGVNARFCFPELVAEFDCQALLSLGSSKYSPPALFNNVDAGNFSSILYKEEEEFNFGSSIDTSNDTPGYLHEKPFVLTELTRHQFGQCAMLGLLNFVGIVWAQSATMPGGLLELPATTSRSPTGGGSLIAIASFLLSKLLKVLRFYAGFFVALPLCRLVIVLIRNYTCRKRNERRRKFATSEL